MSRHRCPIGGEQSGHIVFSNYATTGDGILTALKMMEVMLAEKKPLSVLAAPCVKYPQYQVNVRVADKAAVSADEIVKEAVRKAAAAIGENGRILLRESGTEPVVRVMAEAESADTCKQWVEYVAEVIRGRI